MGQSKVSLRRNVGGSSVLLFPDTRYMHIYIPRLEQKLPISSNCTYDTDLVPSLVDHVNSYPPLRETNPHVSSISWLAIPKSKISCSASIFCGIHDQTLQKNYWQPVLLAILICYRSLLIRVLYHDIFKTILGP